MSHPPMLAAPPTVPAQPIELSPQARSFERGSANRMRLIGTSARLCAQALCAGPSLHNGAGDKPRAHTTAQTIQETSQEKEEKGKEEKRREKKYPGIAMDTMPARRCRALLLHGENATAHTTRTQCSLQRRTNAPCPLRRRAEQAARTGSSNNVCSPQAAARPSAPFSHIFSNIDEKAESAAKESVRIQ